MSNIKLSKYKRNIYLKINKKINTRKAIDLESTL